MSSASISLRERYTSASKRFTATGPLGETNTCLIVGSDTNACSPRALVSTGTVRV